MEINDGAGGKFDPFGELIAGKLQSDKIFINAGYDGPIMEKLP